MPTVRELITQAFRVSGVYAPTEAPNANDTALALWELNGLIDMLRLDNLWSPSMNVGVYYTAGGQTDYSVAFRSQVKGWDFCTDALQYNTLNVGDTITLTTKAFQGNLCANAEPYYQYAVGDTLVLLQQDASLTLKVLSLPATKQYSVQITAKIGTGLHSEVGILYNLNTSTIPQLYSVPDWITEFEVTEVNTMQVLIGSVYVQMNQISMDDYYRTNRNTALNIIPNQFGYNRTRDPWDTVQLQTPSAGGYKVNLSYSGMPSDFVLDDDLKNWPSGYAPALQYGLASKLQTAYGISQSQEINEIWKSRLNSLRMVNDKPILLSKRGGYGLWSVGSDTVIFSGGGL